MQSEIASDRRRRCRRRRRQLSVDQLNGRSRIRRVSGVRCGVNVRRNCVTTKYHIQSSVASSSCSGEELEYSTSRIASLVFTEKMNPAEKNTGKKRPRQILLLLFCSIYD